MVFLVRKEWAVSRKDWKVVNEKMYRRQRRERKAKRPMTMSTFESASHPWRELEDFNKKYPDEEPLPIHLVPN